VVLLRKRFPQKPNLQTAAVLSVIQKIRKILMFKSKLLFSFLVVSLVGCKFDLSSESKGASLSVGDINFDSGSTSTSVSVGNPISLVCFKRDISNIKESFIASETGSKIELSFSNATSIIEFKIENSMVSSYSIETTTEKSKD
jgi:hypothetical protein